MLKTILTIRLLGKEETAMTSIVGMLRKGFSVCLTDLTL